MIDYQVLPLNTVEGHDNLPEPLLEFAYPLLRIGNGAGRFVKE